MKRQIEMTRCRGVLVLSLLLIAPTSAAAQRGLFLRFAVGPGVSVGAASIKGTALALVAKDHALGYGVTDRFAVQVADFGALIRKRVGEYDYINLDGLGLGCAVLLPHSTLVSLSAGYGRVTFAHHWWTATGSAKDDGVAVVASVRREWPIARRWALGIGAPVSFFRTSGDDYTFFDLSLVGSVSFHLTPRQPQRQGY